MNVQRQQHEAKLIFWEPHLSAWQKSDFSVKTYCAQNQLVVSQFKYWQYLLAPQTKRNHRIKQPNALFVEVKTAHSTSPKDSPLTMPNISTIQIQTQQGLCLSCVINVATKHNTAKKRFINCGKNREKNDELHQLIAKLHHQIEKFQQLLFGQKSERRSGKSSKSKLTETIEDNEKPLLSSGKIEIFEMSQSVGRNKMFENLPREVIKYEITESERQCEHCLHKLHCCGKEISEQLDFIPMI